jgi:urease accessory protein
VGVADALLEQIVPGTQPGELAMAGASRLPNDAGLIYKVLGPENQPVRAKVREFWVLVRRVVLDEPIPAVPLWD